MIEQRLLSAKEVAEYLGLSERTIMNMAGDGELHGVQVTSKRIWRFKPADVQAYLADQGQTQRAQPGEASS